jgi:hypothetical protein
VKEIRNLSNHLVHEDNRIAIADPEPFNEKCIINNLLSCPLKLSSDRVILLIFVLKSLLQPADLSLIPLNLIPLLIQLMLQRSEQSASLLKDPVHDQL